MFNPSFYNEKKIFEAVSIVIGIYMGGFFGYLLGKLPAQIRSIQIVNNARFLYNIDNPLLTTLIRDNEYYMQIILYETLGLTILLFFLFFLLLTGKVGGKPSSFQMLIILTIIGLFYIPFEVISYEFIPSRNVIEIPIDASESEKLEINLHIVILDSFRPFAVNYDTNFRLLLSLVLFTTSSWLFSPSTKYRTLRGIIGTVLWGIGIIINFISFAEEKFYYSGSFGIVEGKFNITPKLIPHDLFSGFQLF